MSWIDKLKRIGFKKLGEWSLDNDKIEYKILNDSQKNFLYAFVVDGEIKYIGKSIVTIKDRFQQYINPGKTQSTNIKNNKNIKEELDNEKAVKIYICVDNSNLKCGDFKINMSAGLEDDLIKQIDPSWNSK